MSAINGSTSPAGLFSPRFETRQAGFDARSVAAWQRYLIGIGVREDPIREEGPDDLEREGADCALEQTKKPLVSSGSCNQQAVGWDYKA